MGIKKWMLGVDFRNFYGSWRLANMNLFPCLHLLTSSFRLFKRLFFSLNLIISSFSLVHKLHNLVFLLYPADFFKIFHLIEYSILFDFKFQINLDSSVSFSYLILLKLLTWFLYLVLNFSAAPIYVILFGGVGLSVLVSEMDSCVLVG